jgi:hypothetical protein
MGCSTRRTTGETKRVPVPGLTEYVFGPVAVVRLVTSVLMHYIRKDIVIVVGMRIRL